ncbi:MAG: hypothetical protein HY757_05745 [Nitrospirae bacterium]|nr:hypothetical protein [Nitrospirota bacterium]
MSKKYLHVFWIVSCLLFSSCAKPTAKPTIDYPDYTIIKPNTDFSKYTTFAISQYKGNDDFALKNIIMQVAMKYGFNVIDRQNTDNTPDVDMKYDYTSHSEYSASFGMRSFKGEHESRLDNFSISFIDNKTGEVILTSTYPKSPDVDDAKEATERMFKDIGKAIKLAK